MDIPDIESALKSLVRAIPPASKRLFAEIKQTAETTATHVGALIAFGQARWRARTLERKAFEANVDLGRRLAELGIGDTEQRERLARCRESIRDLHARGAKTRRVAAGLEAEEARLAQFELERGAPPEGAEADYVAAFSARQACRHQQDKVAISRAAIRPINRGTSIRLGIGYFAICVLLIGVTSRAFQPTSRSRQVAPTAKGVSDTPSPEVVAPPATKDDEERIARAGQAVLDAAKEEVRLADEDATIGAKEKELAKVDETIVAKEEEQLADEDATIGAEAKELAKVDETIAAKEKELADLSSVADALRKRIAAKKKMPNATEAKAYRSMEALLADMPKHAYPKFGADGAIERAAARKWVKANLVGRKIQWKATLKKVDISGNDPFTVRLPCTEKVGIAYVAQRAH
ncbi:MAG TPA: hypothetical protein VGX78_16485, partial [Pirellulales bacterium]|nr:hypothetical protein [Pirellulales bacterium]